ncbi:formate-dependent phosphoribosylglycinamide formyltransferase [Sinimarinibacterium flocculans]|uniref:Formate-dependent phosphoribosylglycinamide formyltransferase n=1 Tax=Sinimarinibacterium flocculans TaxID=985250 RepID=A0A318E5H8_9GAMM|nr:formate-dependent phosphoribosylglycinamide formyltransferase [Sinimarinibacterium flocculans]PXV66536.1 formate-dependent phosphoribosylglycinamide formyltransferase [Sinimarinibacterium flocculans]
MTPIGTPLSANATRLLLLGSGELGKEVVIEAQRLGIECIAVDRYADAPAMQVAHRSHVIAMLDGAELRRVVELEKPHFIVPEIEAIHTPTLLALEAEGYTVIPTARAARLTMDREGIRRLAAEELRLPTSRYRFAGTLDEYRAAIAEIGLPCVVKPVMSSSGKGQSTVKTEADVQKAWDYAQSGGRAGAGRVIVEGFVDFDYEITLLTVRHAGSKGAVTTSFCEPIGHLQIDGDYRESWQPHPMSGTALAASQRIAREITGALGGRGLFGVELFIRGDEAIFSEVSPRPHDTGLVTLISQDLSEFALHVRAILGLPVPAIQQHGPAASCAILLEGDRKAPQFDGVAAALTEPDTALRLFGKPEIVGRRRMGVALALGASVDAARARARTAAAAVGAR